MKLPKIFIPEKDLDDVTDSLKSGKDMINRLEDLIFKGRSPIFDNVRQNPYSDLDGLERSIRATYYFGAKVDILKFKNKSYAVHNPSQITDCCVLVKGEYAIFVHTDLSSERDEFKKFYEKLGFKEI